jgi:hypothetical protein
MATKAIMAIFEPKAKLLLPSGYWVEKQDDDWWSIGRDQMNLALKIIGNVPVGKGGSLDREILEFVEMMNHPKRID